MTSATPGKFSKRLLSITPVLPVIPIAVRVAPANGCARRPMEWTASITASISDAAALVFITINIWLGRLSYLNPGADLQSPSVRNVESSIRRFGDAAVKLRRARERPEVSRRLIRAAPVAAHTTGQRPACRARLRKLAHGSN